MLKGFQCTLGEVVTWIRENHKAIRSRGHFYCLGKLLSNCGPQGIHSVVFE